MINLFHLFWMFYPILAGAPNTEAKLPAIRAEAAPSHGQAVLLVQFRAVVLDSSRIISFSWDFDDRDGIQVDKFQKDPTTVYAEPGIYRATLTAANDRGKITGDVVEITVEPRTYQAHAPIHLSDVHGTAEAPYVIEGYDIANPDGNGIFLERCSHIAIRQCRIHHCRGTEEVFFENTSGMAIFAVDSDHLEITGNYIHDNQKGIYLRTSRGSRLIANVIRSSEVNVGVTVSCNHHLEVAHNVLVDNGDIRYFERQRILGFQIGHTDSARIHDNFVIGSTSDGIAVNGYYKPWVGHEVEFVSEGVEIYNNTSRGNEEQGIWLIGVRGAKVYNNYIERNCATGIFLQWNVSDTDIFNNIVIGNQEFHGCTFPQGGAGIGVSNSYDNRIVNNTIVQGGNGIDFGSPDLADDPDGRYPYPSTGNVLKNNIIAYNDGYGIDVHDRTSTVDLSFNNVYANGEAYWGCSPGRGDVSADPRFVDAWHGNFALLANSPCRDRGDPVPAYRDRDGTWNDMGAFGGPYAFAGMVPARAEPLPAGRPYGRLLGMYPNPFVESTAILYQLFGDVRAKVGVYNALGQSIATLDETAGQPGVHVIRWDGADRQGRFVASGFYLIRFEVSGTQQVGKVLRLR